MLQLRLLSVMFFNPLNPHDLDLTLSEIDFVDFTCNKLFC